MTIFFIFIPVLIIFFLILGITLSKNSSSRHGKEIGTQGETEVSNILKKFCKKNKCKFINGIYLPLYDETCEVDHIVFGKFGVAVIETKNIGGKIEGSGKYLTHYIGSKSFELYNPKLQNKTHCDNIKHHLLKAGLSNVPIYPFVVFANDTTIFPPELGIRKNQLHTSLNKLKNADCDVKAMFNIIKSLEVKSPIKKFEHNHKKH
jgi:hypothetical protein